MTTERNPSDLLHLDSLKAGVLIGSALDFPSIIPASVLGDAAPSNVIAMGFIGIGHPGTNVNLKNGLHQEDCRVQAVFVRGLFYSAPLSQVRLC